VATCERIRVREWESRDPVGSMGFRGNGNGNVDGNESDGNCISIFTMAFQNHHHFTSISQFYTRETHMIVE